MTKSMGDMLSAAAPPPPPPGAVEETISDLQRILALPRRPPVDCEPDPITKRYAPETQALIEVVTETYTRGPRISCACVPRRVTRIDSDSIRIERLVPEGTPQQPTIEVTVASFVADHQRHNRDEAQWAEKVRALEVGASVDLPSADGSVGNPCITSLNAVQAWTLWEARQVGGIVGFKGVGSGKTLTSLLAPLAFPHARLAVLLIEPKQRLHYRDHYLRLREHFQVSSVMFENSEGYTVPGTVPLHLYSYSVISQPKNSGILDSRNPDVLILDEAHRACGKSAINRRVKRYVAAQIKKREEAIARGERVGPRAVHLLDWSGTLEIKSIEDTQMLCVFSLGRGSPLPLDPHEAKVWTQVVDPVRQPDTKSSIAYKLYRAFAGEDAPDDSDSDLIELFDAHPQRKVQEGFREWRTWTPGIITASASECDASIYVDDFPVPKMPEIVKDALNKVRMDWLRPDGDDIVEKVQQVDIAKTVACGFYNYWAFPQHPCACPPDRTPTRSQNWCSECALIDEWYKRRKAFNKELRSKLMQGEVNLDSPKLCEEAAERFWRGGYTGKLPTWECESWPAWKEIEKKVRYDEKVRWIGHNTPEAADPKTHPGYFLARAVAEYALEHPCVVWFQSTPLGHKISELSGLPYFNGGPHAEDRIKAETGKRSLIMSIQAHGAGTDGLQHKFDEQVVTETPASNATQQGYEQLFGRLRRRGQKADVINTLVCRHSPELRDALDKARRQAEFNFAMTGLRQNIMHADFGFDG